MYHRLRPTGTPVLLAPARPLLCHAHELDHEGLREEVEAAIGPVYRRRRVVAGELGVTPWAVGVAMRTSGSTVAPLQCRIIEHLTDYRIGEGGAWFRVERKGEA
jgi:hypothetical protein